MKYNILLKRSLAVLSFTIVCVASSVSSAQAIQVPNTGIGPLLVTSVIDSNGKAQFGGCMARLKKGASWSPSLWATLPDTCANQSGGDTFVSFDCAGVYGSKSDGLAVWSSVQLASVTNRAVGAQVTFNRINGYCVANRIDILETEFQ